MTITRKFRSLTWAIAVASAALACYLISYRVSAERSGLEDVEREIAQAREDILELNTEFQTRSRMSQLERWNRRALALEAPGPRQFIEGESELASLLGRDIPGVAEVRQASANADNAEPDTLIDEDVFEVQDSEDLDIPQIRQASYVVLRRNHLQLRAERIAFLDDQLRGDIAAAAASEDGSGGGGE